MGLMKSELQTGREDVTRALHVEDLTIVRTEGVKDEYGGRLPGAEIRIPVRGRVLFPESQPGLTDAKVGGSVLVRVALPWGTDVRGTDALEYDGATISITRVLTGTTALETIVTGTTNG